MFAVQIQVDDEQGFAVPITMPAGHLVELFGNISDSTFDRTPKFGPLPTGAAWGAVNGECRRLRGSDLRQDW